MEEIWKTIIINDNVITNYEISSLGKCRNINKLGWKTKGLLTPKVNKKNGYSQYCVVNNGINYYQYVHRLVAKAFIPNPNDLPEVNHKDGNKINNKIYNLEWVTKKENMQHCFKHRLCGTAKPVNVYTVSGEFINTYNSLSEAYRELGLSVAWNSNFHVSNRQSYNFQFKFEDDEQTQIVNIVDDCKYYQCGLVQLSMDNNFIKYYEKITDAYKELDVIDNGMISQVCKGKRHSFHNYKWMYARDYFK